MTFLLSNRNVLDYLISHGLCTPEAKSNSTIDLKSSKNFNLLVKLANNEILVKQEPHNGEGKTHGEFVQEWEINRLIQTFPELNSLRSLVTEPIHFDPTSSIIIFKYLCDYCDLDDYYSEQQNYPLEIASAIGAAIATIHSKTLDRENYKHFLAATCEDIEHKPSFTRGLEIIRPGIFAIVSRENLKFFKIYQRHSRLQESIIELKNSYQSRCLVHNDLKFSNILLHNEWQTLDPSFTEQSQGSRMVRIIDWEKFNWGDPAFDLGRLVACYLYLWLKSLVVSPDIELETALRLASTPLEKIQPVIAALVKAYVDNFPNIQALSPNFWQRVMQFTGMALIEKIQTKIYYHESFDNTGICMLQIASSLLINPQSSMTIVLGIQSDSLT